MGMSKPTALLTAAITTLGLVSLYFGLSIKSTTHVPPDPNGWDLLIFSQSWPNSVCYEWETENASHTCNMPTEKNLWTVHGIWPTKLGTRGPNFCNDSLQYDPRVTNVIQAKLNRYWTDIHVPNNTMYANSTRATHKLWSHEWRKHGSCAATLPALNSQYKYFKQGIEWSEKYNMKNVLEKSGIKVNSTLMVTDYWKSIKSALKAYVWIECGTNHDTNEQILSEIRICFDKALKLIDCRTTMIQLQQSVTQHHSLTNCNLKKPILYLNNVPKYIPAAALQNTSAISNSTYSNSTADEQSATQLRSKRGVFDSIHNWWTGNKRSSALDKRNEWDVLTFSQLWPYTFCHAWVNVNPAVRSCNLPPNHNQWTVHGIWPTKLGAIAGPFYCNRERPFDMRVLEPIIPDLKHRWTDIKSNGPGLWRYEWLKHGTCALSHPAFDTELKYFQRALLWSKMYMMSDILGQAGVNPNDSYPLALIYEAVRYRLGKNPRIHCIHEKQTGRSYLEEIRLCFNKNLQLIDCVNPEHPAKYNTNCPLVKEVFYIGAVHKY